jgi:hypothetical protein
VTRALVAQVTSPKPKSSVQNSIARCVRAVVSRNMSISKISRERTCLHKYILLTSHA